MRRALIFGSNGRGAQKLISHYLAKGVEVVGIAKQEARAKHPNYKHISDPNFCLDSERINSMFREVTFDYVYHLAAVHGPSSSSINDDASRRSMWQVGPEPTRILCEAILRFSPNSRLIVAGSSQVFTGSGPQKFNESSPMNPVSNYAQSKAEMRTLVAEFAMAYGLKGSTAILFTHDSWPSPHGFLASTIVEQAISAKGKADSRPRFQLLRPNSFADLSHRDDVVRALRLVAERADGGDFLIGSSLRTSLRQLIADFCVSVCLETPAVAALLDEKTYEGPIADTTKIREKVGWTPKSKYLDVLIEGYRAKNRGRG